eukprot:12919893-Ditylum_brightwellii.AAC.1
MGGVLEGSGGKLSPDKSCWWLVWWSWKDGKAQLATKEALLLEAKIRTRQSTTTSTLKQADPN